MDQANTSSWNMLTRKRPVVINLKIIHESNKNIVKTYFFIAEGLITCKIQSRDFKLFFNSFERSLSGQAI